MKKDNKRLGKGLEALFGDDVNELITDIENNYNKDEIVQIPLNKIAPNPYQPRKVFDEEALDELASSIKEHGIFQPIILKQTSSGYNIVAGERRFRAARKVKLDTIPAIIVDFDEQLMMEIALLENIQRENLNALEEANALKLIMDKNNYTQEEVASKMGKSRAHIANLLRLLTLNKKAQEYLLANKISMGHARVLVGLDDDTSDYIVDEIVKNKLSVRDVEKLVSTNKEKKKVNNTNKTVSLEIEEIERLLQEKFKTKVNIKNKKIEITYLNNDDLNRLLEILDISID
ncbi:MAG: ParB/RepB/Spo0J family partition protein [Bacilli bacterium]|jgi:ParB family chromosome partitioning protein|nr:ParB/RepB/Spo0J family partition protein [Bacilli bacterium]